MDMGAPRWGTMKSHRPALDGVRGLAALSVVSYHLGHWLNESWIATNSDVSVDLFFCLSGYVLPLAYLSRRAVLNNIEFFRIRLIRLAPLIILGSVISIIYILLKIKTTHVFIQPAIILFIFIGAIFNIPIFGAPHDVGGPMIFPLNGPQYTLFLEFMANAVWWSLRNYVRPLFIGILIVFASLLVVLFGLGGDVPQTFFQGFARVALSFALGLAVYYARLNYDFVPKFNQFIFLISGLITIVIFYIPFYIPLWGKLVWIICVSPLLVLSGSHLNITDRWAKIALWLGETSYAIYALHYPIFCWVNGIYRIAFGSQNFFVEAPIAFFCVIVISRAAFRIYDKPIRLSLTRLFDGAGNKFVRVHGLRPHDIDQSNRS
jgi:peptidoglycan/LPS O-acetylase OafA/YrhL